MTGRLLHRRCLPAIALLLAAAVLLPVARAAEPKDYAYMFMQGKLTESSNARPLVRASVRLTAENVGAYETMTDSRGVFTFDKLPFATFELRITTPEGKVIRGITRSDPDDPEAMRFNLKVGKGYGDGIRVEAARDRVSVDVPEPKTRWRKLWAELGIFVGVAGLLAL